MRKIRLDKFISTQGIGSRKQAKEWVKQKLITVNGELVKSSEQKIDENCDVVAVNGKKYEYKKYIYIMMNKPQGVICSTDDKRHKTVLDLLPSELVRPNLFPAGRLDIGTTGFVLITDDGDFAHNMLAPKKHVTKLYYATVNGKVTKEHIELFEKGITIDSGIECLPAKLRVIEDADTPKVEIEIMEGKFHQVKRMFEAIGLKVLTLHRQKIGQLELDENLAPGECREMLHKEITAILCGLPNRF